MLETRQIAPASPSWACFPGADPHKIPIDSNGNLTSKTEGTDTWTYTWNAENQLTKVEKNGAEVVRFAYDPLGRRVEKVAGGVTTGFTYDGDSVLRETGGATTATYVHAFEIDEPLAVDNGAGLSYFHGDALGSIVKLTNATGAVALTRRYDAWGGLDTSASESGYGFTGREWDPATGLYYYRARYYDPRIGRFISADPIGLMGGLNLYRYVRNDPVNTRDPFGYAPWDCAQCAWYTRKCIPKKTECIQKAQQDDPLDIMVRNNSSSISDALNKECVRSVPECGEAVEACLMCGAPPASSTPKGVARGFGIGMLWDACKKLFGFGSSPSPGPSPSPTP